MHLRLMLLKCSTIIVSCALISLIRKTKDILSVPTNDATNAIVIYVAMNGLVALLFGDWHCCALFGLINWNRICTWYTITIHHTF